MRDLIRGLLALLLWTATPAPASAQEVQPAETRPAETQAGTDAGEARAPAAPPAGIVGEAQDRIAAAALIGTWVNDEGPARIQIAFDRDGHFRLGSTRGVYRVDRNN